MLTIERRHLMYLCHQCLRDSLFLLLIQVRIEVVGGMQSLISWLKSKSSVSPAEMEATVAIRTSGPPTGCTIPGPNAVSQLRAHFVQGQHELSGTPIMDFKNAAPKRPYSPTSKGSHSPTSEEYPKKTVDGEKVRKGGLGQGGFEVVLVIDVE